MKRTTVFIPEALERDLQLYARRVGKPTAMVFREAVAAYLADRRPSSDLPSFTAAFDSGTRDTAERHEALLFRTLEPHPAEPPAGDPRPKTRTRRPVRRRAR